MKVFRLSIHRNFIIIYIIYNIYNNKYNNEYYLYLKTWTSSNFKNLNFFELLPIAKP